VRVNLFMNADRFESDGGRVGHSSECYEFGLERIVGFRFRV
jgi:hypothetical protein